MFNVFPDTSAVAFTVETLWIAKFAKCVQCSDCILDFICIYKIDFKFSELSFLMFDNIVMIHRGKYIYLCS